MKKLPVAVKSSARAEFDEAIDFFDSRWPGAGKKFALTVQSVFDRIAANPEMHAIVQDDVRKALVPGHRYYVIYYRVKSTRIEVLSIFHTSQDPKIWQDRI